MTALGTDILAWACIVGSAATGGGLTLAFLGDGEESAPIECQVETRADAGHIVVSEGRQAVVVRVPGTTTRLNHECGSVLSGKVLLHRGAHAEEIRLHVEDLRQEVEEARIHVEIGRAQAELAREMGRAVRLRRVGQRGFPEEARVRMREAQARMEANLELVTEAEAAAAAEIEAVKVILKKAGEGTGGG